MQGNILVMFSKTKSFSVVTNIGNLYKFIIHILKWFIKKKMVKSIVIQKINKYLRNAKSKMLTTIFQSFPTSYDKQQFVFFAFR